MQKTWRRNAVGPNIRYLPMFNFQADNYYNPIHNIHHLNMPPSAQPLKVPATPSKSTEFDKDKTPVASKQQMPSKLGTIAPNDISSPHELTAFVSSQLFARCRRM